MSFKQYLGQWARAAEQQQNAAYQQAAAQSQSMQQAALFGQSSYIVGYEQGSSGGGGASMPNSGTLQFNSWHDQGYFSIPVPTNPNQEAEELFYSLNNIDPHHIKEIVVKEAIYNQMVLSLCLDVEKDPELKKQLTYNNPFGMILIKNEKYQFDLDKYMEDAPVKL